MDETPQAVARGKNKLPPLTLVDDETFAVRFHRGKICNADRVQVV